MSDVMDKLHADHAHIARLMSLLEEQIQLIHAEENPDAPLMQDIMAYMTHYPDLIHHPLEDLIFEHVITHRTVCKGYAAVSEQRARQAGAGGPSAESECRLPGK